MAQFGLHACSLCGSNSCTNNSCVTTAGTSSISTLYSYGGGGGGGTTGYPYTNYNYNNNYYTSNPSYNYSTNTFTYLSSAPAASLGYKEDGSAVMEFSGDNPRIQTSKGVIDLNKLILIMENIQDILKIADAEMKKMEEYPALETAYEHWKMVNALVRPAEEC